MSRRAAAALVAVGVLVGALISQPNSWRESDGQWAMASAIVRVGGAGVYVHSNSGHVAVGIESVEVGPSGELIVTRETVPGAKIAACIVDEDETLSRLGIVAGCSSGGRISNIWLYDRTGAVVRADSPSLPGASNLWIFWAGFIPPTSEPTQ